jgi:hypothetical protein
MVRSRPSSWSLRTSFRQPANGGLWDLYSALDLLRVIDRAARVNRSWEDNKRPPTYPKPHKEHESDLRDCPLSPPKPKDRRMSTSLTSTSKTSASSIISGFAFPLPKRIASPVLQTAQPKKDSALISASLRLRVKIAHPNYYTAAALEGATRYNPQGHVVAPCGAKGSRPPPTGSFVTSAPHLHLFAFPAFRRAS